jgi:Rrf2 family protein
LTALNEFYTFADIRRIQTIFGIPWGNLPMKLSTRSRYGTRLILDIAQHQGDTPIQLGEIARRQNISLKYLEQIIRPLKRAQYIKSFRGSKGGHMLNKPPEQITVGEVVALLEGGSVLTHCSKNPKACSRAERCPTRYLWMEASEALFARLNQITFADLLASGKEAQADICAVDI